METPASIIQNVTDEYIRNYSDVESAVDINDGRCFFFAEDVADAIGADAKVIEAVGDGTSHGWVEWNDTAYDSEAPNGADSWTDLPHFKRWGGDEIDIVAVR